MGLDQAIKKMTPEIAAKLAKAQEIGSDDAERGLSDEEYNSIEEVWSGRKENHIHRAVERIWHEPENCGYVFMSRNGMDKLVALLTVVNRNRDAETAKLLLPTQDGFFFGGTEYGEHYFENVRRELEDFSLILKEWDEDMSYAYWEWW